MDNNMRKEIHLDKEVVKRLKDAIYKYRAKEFIKQYEAHPDKAIFGLEPFASYFNLDIQTLKEKIMAESTLVLSKGGMIETPSRMNKSMECLHKPTAKGSKCTRRTLSGNGRCWQH